MALGCGSKRSASRDREVAPSPLNTQVSNCPLIRSDQHAPKVKGGYKEPFWVFAILFKVIILVVK